jgi:hypothetical protein
MSELNPTDEELQAAHCLATADGFGSDPEVVAFRRRLRLRQGRWRERQGHPIGDRVVNGHSLGPLGSTLPDDFARETGANFITPAAHDAVLDRINAEQPGESIDQNRLFSNLLSSMPLCFNLFGELWADHNLATNAVRAWWPDSTGRVDAVRFEWSPGRDDWAYLGNRSAFDVAFDLALSGGRRGIIGVETKYHETAFAPTRPPRKLRHYASVTERSAVFREGAAARLAGSDLEQLWLDHLLLLSMLQHPSERWEWGRFVLVYPSENVSSRDAVERYQVELIDDATFQAVTLEQLLDAPGALPAEVVDKLRDRYLP